MKIPNELKYTKEHEWLRIEGTTAVVGITEFAQGELGEIVFCDLPAKGKGVKKGDSLCVVESTKAASDVYAPVTGTVIEGNGALSNDPSLVNSDPYGSGWMVKLDGVKAEETASLLSSTQYAELIRSK